VIGCVCVGGGEGVLCSSFGGGVAQESRIGHNGGVSFGGEEAAAECTSGGGSPTGLCKSVWVCLWVCVVFLGGGQPTI
jgi:hypothetical protein